MKARGYETVDRVILEGLVLGHHQLEVPCLIRLQTSEHGGSGSVLLECGLKLGSSHLADRSIVLELAEEVVMLNVWARTGRKGWTLHLLLTNHLEER